MSEDIDTHDDAVFEARVRCSKVGRWWVRIQDVVLAGGWL